jgi:hypothetical protein
MTRESGASEPPLFVCFNVAYLVRHECCPPAAWLLSDSVDADVDVNTNISTSTNDHRIASTGN